MRSPNATGTSSEELDPPPLRTIGIFMDIGEVLAADLGDLRTEFATDSVTSSTITMLRRDLQAAVRSLLGFSITVSVSEPPTSVAINIVDEPLHAGIVGDCLVVQFPEQPANRTITLTVYAGDPGALRALRRDLVTAFDLPATTMDASIPASIIIQPGVTGLTGFSRTHQAVGVLIGSGHDAHSASVELMRQAHHHPQGLAGAVDDLLAEPQRVIRNRPTTDPGGR